MVSCAVKEVALFFSNDLMRQNATATGFMQSFGELRLTTTDSTIHYLRRALKARSPFWNLPIVPPVLLLQKYTTLKHTVPEPSLRSEERRVGKESRSR